jgi:replication factor A1
MTATLTAGAIKNAYAKAGSPPETTILPEVILQVIHLKHLQSSTNGGADRYKLVVSDGTNYMSAMLSSQLNTLVTSNALTRYSVLKVKRYMVNIVNSNGNQIRYLKYS